MQENLSSGFPTRSDTNRTKQSQKRARSLKFRIQEEEDLTKVGIHFGHVRMCATPYPISWIIFILDLGPSYTDNLLEFRWVQIAHLS